MKLEFHHINFVSKDVDKMDKFYKKILNMESIPLENFPRTEETDESGYSGKINFPKSWKNIAITSQHMHNFTSIIGDYFKFSYFNSINHKL